MLKSVPFLGSIPPLHTQNCGYHKLPNSWNKEERVQKIWHMAIREGQSRLPKGPDYRCRSCKSRRRQERKAHPSNTGRGASQTADPTFQPLEHKPLCSTAGLTSGQATELCSIIIKENAMVFHSGKYASVPHSF